MIRVDPKVSAPEPQLEIEAAETETEQATDSPEAAVYTGTGTGRSASERAYDSEPTFATSSKTPDSELSIEQKRALVEGLTDDVVMDHVDRLWPTLLEIHDHRDRLRGLQPSLARLDRLDDVQRGDVLATSAEHIRSIVDLADQAGIATPQLLRSASRTLYVLDSHGHETTGHERQDTATEGLLLVIGHDIKVAPLEVGERSRPDSAHYARAVLIDLRGFRG
ncbi:MAG: hypothetical protein AB7R00_19235 [Kofleriaceae bacterium]